MVSRRVLILSLLALSACATGPERSPEVYEGRPEAPTPAAVPPETVEPGQRSASETLLDRARGARYSGDLVSAEALLLRAQRLDPANPEVYLELAELYAQRGQDDSSRSAAQRGLLYCDAGSCHRLRELARPPGN